MNNAKSLVIFALGLFLSITVLLDYQFRLVLFTGFLLVCYTALNKISSFQRLQNSTQLVGQQQQLIAESQQNLVSTLVQLKRIQDGINSSEYDQMVEIGQNQVNLLERSIQKEQKLQRLRHNKEYQKLEDSETRQNKIVEEQCIKDLDNTERGCQFRIQAATSDCTQRLADLQERMKSHKHAETKRLQVCSNKAAQDLRSVQS